MFDLVFPAISTAVILFMGAVIGIWPTQKLIRVKEARHDLRQGSAGWLREISGWAIVVAWLLILWFLGTIIGDWAMTGDLNHALERSALRLRIILEIMAALGDQ